MDTLKTKSDDKTKTKVVKTSSGQSILHLIKGIRERYVDNEKNVITQPTAVVTVLSDWFRKPGSQDEMEALIDVAVRVSEGESPGAAFDSNDFFADHMFYKADIVGFLELMLKQGGLSHWTSMLSKLPKM
jgi:hypothetical protein